jgi:hypothetical protein
VAEPLDHKRRSIGPKRAIHRHEVAILQHLFLKIQLRHVLLYILFVDIAKETYPFRQAQARMHMRLLRASPGLVKRAATFWLWGPVGFVLATPSFPRSE